MANGKTCKNCSKDLTGRQESFCSDKCRKQFHNDKRKKVRKCLNCGKETTKKYCSKECGVKYRNDKRKREHTKELLKGYTVKSTNGIELTDESKKEILDYLVRNA